ncbi:hypothetical protein AOLI_G00323630 [Acnodon oligacanthus]
METRLLPDSAVRLGARRDAERRLQDMKDSSSGDDLSARQGLKKSLTCETSELDSNDELEASKKLGKRRPKPIHFYGDTDADSEDESTLRRSCKSKKASSACCAAPPPMPPPSVSSVQHFPFASPPIQTQLPSSASAFYKQKGSLLHLSIRANVLHLSIRANPLHLSIRANLQKSPPRTASYTTALNSCTSSAEPTSYTSALETASYTSLSRPNPFPPASTSFTSASTSSMSAREPDSASQVFVPTVRMASGREPILCTPVEWHILTMLETVKHQVTRISTMVNTPSSRDSGMSDTTAEMPNEMIFPL